MCGGFVWGSILIHRGFDYILIIAVFYVVRHLSLVSFRGVFRTVGKREMLTVHGKGAMLLVTYHPDRGEIFAGKLLERSHDCRPVLFES